MPDIRAEDRVELRPERVVAAESGGVHPVVGLAAEIVGFGVEVDPVLLAGDLAGREIVDVINAAGQIGLFGIGQAAAFAQCRAYPDACAQAPWRCAAPNARSDRRRVGWPSRPRLRE